jgi:hypothetical protein
MFWFTRSAPIDPELTVAMQYWLIDLGVEVSSRTPAKTIHKVIDDVYPDGLTGFFTDYIYGYVT